MPLFERAVAKIIKGIIKEVAPELIEPAFRHDIVPTKVNRIQKSTQANNNSSASKRLDNISINNNNNDQTHAQKSQKITSYSVSPSHYDDDEYDDPRDFDYRNYGYPTDDDYLDDHSEFPNDF